MSQLDFSWKFLIPLNFCLKDVELLVHKTTKTTFRLLLKHKITFWDLFAHCWHHTNKRRCSLLRLMHLLSLIWHPLVHECVSLCVCTGWSFVPCSLIQRVRAKPELTSLCQPLGSGEEECEWWLMASLQKLLSGAQKRPERQIAACTHRCLSLECTDRQACREKALSLLLATLPSYAYTSRKHTHAPHAEAKSCQQSVEWTHTTVTNTFCCI